MMLGGRVTAWPSSPPDRLIRVTHFSVRNTAAGLERRARSRASLARRPPHITSRSWRSRNAPLREADDPVLDGWHGYGFLPTIMCITSLLSAAAIDPASALDAIPSRFKDPISITAAASKAWALSRSIWA